MIDYKEKNMRITLRHGQNPVLKEGWSNAGFQRKDRIRRKNFFLFKNKNNIIFKIINNQN